MQIKIISTNQVLDALQFFALYPKTMFSIPLTNSELQDFDAQIYVAPFNLAAAKTIAERKIDADADAVYGAVIGNRGQEYQQADADSKAYDWRGVLRFLLPFVKQSPHEYFCSEAVAAALGLVMADKTTPQDLWKIFGGKNERRSN